LPLRKILTDDDKYEMGRRSCSNFAQGGRTVRLSVTSGELALFGFPVEFVHSVAVTPYREIVSVDGVLLHWLLVAY
jgi:hypothetical protein